jgi:universal stress protein E
MSKRIAHVLVGSSLLPTSDDVVRSALLVARAAGAKLHLVHAHTPMALAVVEAAPVLLADDQLAVEAMLSAQVSRLGIASAELGSSGLALGPPHRVIIDRAAEIGADLIVVGAAETSPTLARYFGSTADRVVRKATRPVLVVRGKYAGSLAKVLFPVDLSTLSADALRAGLAQVRWLGLAPGALLEGLYVLDILAGSMPRDPVPAAEVEAYARERLASFLDRHCQEFTRATGLRVMPQLVRAEAEQGILDRIKEWNPDLVVLGTHGASGFERLLLGSIAGAVMRRALVSTLVVPPEAAAAESIAREAEARVTV